MAADEDRRDVMEIEEQHCISTPTIGECWFLLSKIQLLSASITIIQNMVEVPIYRFVQQPSLTLHPNVIIIPGDHIYGRKGGYIYGDLSIGESGNIIIFDAIPISVALEDISTWKQAMKKDTQTAAQETMIMNPVVAAAQQLSTLERQRNWCIQIRGGKNGRIHKYYYHLQTNIVHRSLIEVHQFVEHAKLPDRFYKGMDMPKLVKAAEGTSKRVRGSKLIKPVKVGYYDLSSNTIFRSATPLEDPEDSKKKDSKKRKRQEEVGLVDEVGQDAQDPHRSPLYDFVPLNN